jgi:subtilisin-like proprotein convertase family protein
VIISGTNLRILTFGNSTGTSRVTIRISDPDGGSSEVSFLVTVVPAQQPQFANTQSVTIPQSGTGTPYPSTINVANVAGTITRVTVTLNELSHTFPADLDILLVGPQGQRSILMSDAGSGEDLVLTRLTFQDGSPSLPVSGQISSGTYSPSNYEAAPDNFPAPGPGSILAGNTPLSAFNGTNPNGTWSLYIVDDGAPDSGTLLNGWLLNIQTTAPTISFLPDIVLAEDASTNITFRVEDGDTAAGNLQVSASSAGVGGAAAVTAVAVGGTGNDRVLTIIPRQNVSGQDIVTVTVTDGVNSASRSFNVTISPVNDAPLLLGLPTSGTAVPANRTLTINFQVVDVDGDPVSVAFSSFDPSAGSVTVSGSGLERTLTFVPSGTNPASTTISVSATDGQLSTTNSFLVNVVAPVAASITDVPDITLPENTSTNIDLVVFIPNADPTNIVITPTIQGSPILTLAFQGTGAQRTMTITPLANQVGTNQITLTITDARGGNTNTASTTFLVTIQNVDNDAPIVGQVPDQTATLGEQLVVNISVSDPDTALGDLTFSFTADNGTNILRSVTYTLGTNANTVVATITPNAAGTDRLNVAVTDGENLTVMSFGVTVVGTRPPVIAPIANVQTPEDVPVTVTLNVSDADTPLAQLQITGEASNTNLVNAVTISNNGTTVTAAISLKTNAFGTSTITIRASDGTNTSSANFTLTVIEVPECPTLGAIANQTGVPDATIRVLLPVTDPDTAFTELVPAIETANGTAVVRSATFEQTSTSITAVLVLQSTPGTDTVTVRVVEPGECAPAVRSFTVTIESGTLTPATLGISRQGTNIVLNVTGQSGATYAIESTTDFRSWQQIGTVVIEPDGATAVAIPATGRAQFFRVRGGPAPARAQALAYEGYEYPTGTTISTNQNGGTGWTAGWTPDVETPTNHIVMAPGLEYGDGVLALVTSPGSVFYTANSNNVPSGGNVQSFRTIAGGVRNTGTTWISFIGQRMGPTVTNTGTPNNRYPRAANISFFEGTSERFAIGNGTAAVSNLWTIIPGGGIGNTTNDHRSATPMDQQAFIVVRVDHLGTAGGNDDAAYMWVNPPLGSTPDISTANARAVGGTVANFSFDRVRPFVGAVDPGNNRPYAELALDELRIGTTFASVAPTVADITQPFNPVDLVTGTDTDNSTNAPPAAEGVARVIDNVSQKYLNFFEFGSGFIVTPLGSSVVNGLRVWTANDAVERDPASYKIEGWNGTAWTVISEGPLNLPAGRNPGATTGANSVLRGGLNQTVRFNNTTPYTSYRVTFPTVKNATTSNSMQVAEVDLLSY